jgi:hypothetical protein
LIGQYNDYWVMYCCLEFLQMYELGNWVFPLQSTSIILLMESFCNYFMKWSFDCK